MKENREESCDTRIWSPECQRGEFSTLSDKYLCVSCGTIPHLKQEVHHEMFPHVVGDPDFMH